VTMFHIVPSPFTHEIFVTLNLLEKLSHTPNQEMSRLYGPELVTRDRRLIYLEPAESNLICDDSLTSKLELCYSL
jgi:hypothetical protein